VTDEIVTTCTEKDEDPICTRTHKIRNYVKERKLPIITAVVATTAAAIVMVRNAALSAELDDMQAEQDEDEFFDALESETTDTDDTDES